MWWYFWETSPMASFKSGLVTQASGSVGGLTFSHNQGGLYMRARSIPVNPNTAQQQAVRNLMAQLVAAWNDDLSAGQRATWDLYAFNTPVTSKLGEPINLSGLNMYVRSNLPRLQAGKARVDQGPATFNLGSFTAPTFSIDTANDEGDVSFTDTDEWANEDDAFALVYFSRPFGATINYFKGPYRFANTIAGNSSTPPTSPAAITLPFPVEAGQQVGLKFSVSRADGRLSSPFRSRATAS